MKRFIGIYAAFIRQQIKALMEYRVDFLLGVIGLGIFQVAMFIMLLAVFTQIRGIGPYTFDEVLFFFGFAQFIRGIDHIYNDNIWFVAWYYIREGRFYQFLIRPINPVLHIVMERISIDGFGELILSLIIMFYAKGRLGLVFSALDWLVFAWFTLCSLSIYFAIKLTFAAISFWTTQSGEVMTMAYEINSFTRYPLDIYKNRVIQFAVTFILPFAVASYFPILYFIRDSAAISALLHLPPWPKLWIPVFTGLIASLSLFIAFTVWNRGIRNFQATGN